MLWSGRSGVALAEAAGLKLPEQAESPSIPRDYVDWLKRRYASVDLLGQDTKQGHAVTLSQVYVPALTQRSAAAAIPKMRRTRRSKALRSEDGGLACLWRVDRASLYVAGAAGAGKSTFCRWAALQGIEGAPSPHPVPAPEGFEEPVPANCATACHCWSRSGTSPGDGLRPGRRTGPERAGGGARRLDRPLATPG